MGWEDIQARKYSSFGRCIYCGSDGGGEGLRDEHLVPYSLGGHAALKQASCRACEAATSRVELYIGRHIFYQLRSHVGAPSRRKLPTELPAFVSIGDKESIVDFAARDHPFALMLPVWDWPGILRQVQPSSEFSRVNVRAYNFVPANLGETLGLPESALDPIIHVGPGTIDNVMFARAIAKIAYCSAVAKYGLNGFRHLVTPEIILGKYSCTPYFVGSDPGDPLPPIPAFVIRWSFRP